MARWSAISNVYDALKAGSIDTTDNDPHDRGIIRAMNAKYRPNKDVIGDPEKTVFIARLNPKTTEDTLHSKFSEYGDIERVRLVRDLVTGFSRCYAFVEYQSENATFRAQRDADKTELEGSEIFVDFECERKLKGWIPRRLGGGLGGKKESGQLRFGGKDRPFRKPFDIENRLRGQHSTRFRDDNRPRSELRYSDEGRRNDRSRYESDSRDGSSQRSKEGRDQDREYGDSYRSPAGSSKDKYRDRDYGDRSSSVSSRDKDRVYGDSSSASSSRDKYRDRDYADRSSYGDRSPTSSSRNKYRDREYGDSESGYTHSSSKRTRSRSRDR